MSEYIQLLIKYRDTLFSYNRHAKYKKFLTRLETDVGNAFCDTPSMETKFIISKMRKDMKTPLKDKEAALGKVQDDILVFLCFIEAEIKAMARRVG